MKKLALLLLLAFAVNSCSTDSGNEPEVFYELLPIDQCDMPYRMSAGQTYEFKMFFKMPTTCHAFKGIYFEEHGNLKKIAIQSMVFENVTCQVINYSTDIQPAVPLMEKKYKFTAGAPGTIYTFRIWNGKNQQGQDTFYDVTVPVVN